MGETILVNLPILWRRCAILYRGKRVACKKCYRLAYPSQSEDKGRHNLE